MRSFSFFSWQFVVYIRRDLAMANLSTKKCKWEGNRIERLPSNRTKPNRKLANFCQKVQRSHGYARLFQSTEKCCADMFLVALKICRILDVHDNDVFKYGNWVNMGKTDQCTWDMMHTTWQLCRLHSNSNFEAWFFHHRHWKSCFYGIMAKTPRESRLNSHVSRFQNQTVWSNHYEINPRNPE